MRNGEKIWYCRRTSGDTDIVTYADPVEVVVRFGYMTVQPTRVALNNMAGYYTTEEYGEHTNQGWNIIANYNIFCDVLSVGDVLYLDGIKPDSNAVNGTGANAIITSVREQNLAIFYTVKKLDGV